MAKPVTRWGRNLQRIIRERGLKQGAVAAAADLDKNAISRLYAASDVKSTTLERLATAMKIDVVDFFEPERSRDLSRHTNLRESALSGGVANGPDSTRVLSQRLDSDLAFAHRLQDAVNQIGEVISELDRQAVPARRAESGRPRRRRSAH